MHRCMLLVGLFIFAALCATTQARALITSTHTIVQPGITENVKIKCSLSKPSAEHLYSQLFRLRILRGALPNRKTIASITTGKRDAMISNITVTGKFIENGNNYHDSYLEVKWPVATPDLADVYLCEFDGIAIKGSSMLLSEKIVIANKSITVEELKAMIDIVNAESAGNHTELRQEIEVLRSELEILRNAGKKAQEDIMVTVNNSLADAEKRLRKDDLELEGHLSELSNRTGGMVDELDEKIQQLQNLSVQAGDKLGDLITMTTQTIKKELDQTITIVNANISNLADKTSSQIETLGQNISRKMQEEGRRRDTVRDQKLSDLHNKTKMEFDDEISKLRSWTQVQVNRLNDTDIEIFEELAQMRKDFKSQYATKEELAGNISSLSSTFDETLHEKEREMVGEFTKTIREISTASNKQHREIRHAIKDMASSVTEDFTKLDDQNKMLREELAELDSKYENITDDLRNQSCECEYRYPPTTPTTTTPTTTTVNAELWPEGTFGLVSPDSGCPESYGFSWDEGSITFHTSTDFNDDYVSKSSHFKLPVFLTGHEKFVRWHYCSKRDAVPNMPRMWPKGAYCINRVGGSCPYGFESVFIQYDGEHRHPQHKTENAPDMEQFSSTIDRVFYCCRKDGNPHTPIPLPTTKPFYLYK